VFQTALCFRSQGHAVTGDEFKQAQDDGRIVSQLRRRSQIDTAVRNGKFVVGEPRTPIAELRRQRAFALFVGVQGAARFAKDDTRVAEIFAHQGRRLGSRLGGWFMKFEIRLRGERFLRIEGQEILIAASLIVQETAQGMQECAGNAQAGGHFLIGLA